MVVNGGIILLIIAILGTMGTISGIIILPFLFPFGVTFAGSIMLGNSLIKKHPHTSIHAVTVWIGIAWIIGHVLIKSWGCNFITQSLTGMLLLATPFAAIAPRAMQKRFTVMPPGEKLKLLNVTQKPLNTPQTIEKPGPPETLVFDLGEQVDFENR